MPRRPTIVDIAKEAGLSAASVSQALRPRHGSNIKLPEETVARVKAVARKLNYRPHAGARSIRSKTFQNIGFFVAKRGLMTRSPDGYLAGAHDAAEENGFRLINIQLAQQAGAIVQSLPTALEERNLDCLIISSYHRMTREIHDRLEEENLPVIYLNDKHPSNSIHVDDVAGAADMTRYLIERGYRRIAFVLRKDADPLPLQSMHHSAADRIEGYQGAMAEAGLAPALETLFATEVAGEGLEVPEDWQAWIDKYDALFAYDDDLANQLGRLFYQNRLHVPNDIALAGYNGDYAAASAWQSLTSMHVPAYEMGRAAFELAHQLIFNKNQRPSPSLVFKAELSIGDSA